MPRVFHTPRRIRFDDVDYLGVLYFPNQVRIFMNAFEDFFREATGIAWTEFFDKENLILPTANLNVNYERPLRLGEESEVRVAIARIGTQSFTVRYEVFEQSSGARTCNAEHTMVFVDRQTWQPLAVPEKYRTALSAYLVA